jgi:hypothetical protein
MIIYLILALLFISWILSAVLDSMSIPDTSQNDVLRTSDIESFEARVKSRYNNKYNLDYARRQVE